MVADIVGSSLILQQDRPPGFDLYDTFKSILLPVLEKGGGFDIEFTGDDVSAIFRDCYSAVKTGFAVHKVLADWNSTLEGPSLSVRIGIHAGKHDDGAHQRNLPLVIASRLQSLGRADALCVTAPVIDEIKPVSPVYVQNAGMHSLGFSTSAPVFFVFDEKPRFLAYQQLLLGRIRHQYGDAVKLVLAAPVLLLFALLSATLFDVSNESRVQNVEVAAMNHFNAEKHGLEITSTSNLLREGLDAMPNINVVAANGKSTTDIRLVYSFQQLSGKVRFTWGIIQQHDREQVSGGDITGERENFANLQRQLVQAIISRLKEK